MNDYATQEDFNRAPVGHPFLEACGACGLETGVIVIKNRGRHTLAGSSLLPRRLVNSESRCESCHFLGAFFASEEIEDTDPRRLAHKWGAAKMVTEDKNGVRSLIAWVPFCDADDLDKELSDGTPFRFHHGMVIGCVKHDDGTAEMVKVLEQGT